MERRQARRDALSSRLSGESGGASEAREPESGSALRPERQAEERPKPTKERPKPSVRTRQRGQSSKPPAGKRAVTALAAARTAFGKGGRATAHRAAAAQPFVARVGGAVGRALRIAAVAVLRVAALVERVLRKSIGFVAAVVAAAVSRLSRFLTPERAVFGVTVAAATCLIVAQFIDYRGVEIDQAAYADVLNIVKPPQRDVRTAGEAHAYLLIPVALLAVGLGAMALRSRRWQLGRLVSAAGLAAVAVILLVDLPKGLDEGDLTIRYNGAKAVLGDGFYAELAAAGALVFCGLLLSLHLRPAKRRARGRRRERRRRNQSGKAPSLARSGT